jgi:D-xylonolactonase
MIEYRVVADFGDLCGECPVWDPAAETLYCTDLTGNRFYSYQPASGQSRIVNQGLQISGFRRNRQGGFVVASHTGIHLWDGAGDLSLVVDEVSGAKCVLNDCAADPCGRLLAGSTFYDPAGGYPLGALFAIERDGSARILDHGFHLANGIGFSPGGRTLYVADSIVRRIFAYDYNPAAGTAGNRRVFVAVPDDEGIPDGLTVDAEGFVWSAQWYGSCVVRYDPDGKAERRIVLPAKQISSVTFGGPDLTDIFVTSAAQSEPTPAMPGGYDPVNGLFGGQLYCVGTNVHGKPEPLVDIQPH